MAQGNESIYIDKGPSAGDHADLDDVMQVLARNGTETK